LNVDLFLALFILLAGSLFWVAVSRPPNKPAWLMAVYLICSANVVLSGYIANSFRMLDRQWVMLLIHYVRWGGRLAGLESLWETFICGDPSRIGRPGSRSSG
jgi:hypothetical protein